MESKGNIGNISGDRMSGEKVVRFREDPSVIRNGSQRNFATVTSATASSITASSMTAGSVAGRTRTDKKVLVVHFQESVRRIAFSERSPADAIERSIKRECRLDQQMFSLLDCEGDSIVIDGSMEPGEVWLNTETTFEFKKKKKATVSAVRPVDSFISILDENAIQQVYDVDTKCWTNKPIQVKLDIEPFASGSLRRAHYLRILSEPNEIYVAKISIDPNEDKDTYYQDVETQMYSKKYAQAFNALKPPKQVDFVMASLLSFPNRTTLTLWALEKHISGRYRKHNNNYGYVSEDERSTPQAFSHFTYEASLHKILICDIQGVGDLYTDPQMHTDDSVPLAPGKGNLGQKGFQRFLQTHQCNAICKSLRLPPVNARQVDMGTRPDGPGMTYRPVDVGLYATDITNTNANKSIDADSRQPLLTGGSPTNNSPRQHYEVQGSRSSEKTDKSERTCSCTIV